MVFPPRPTLPRWLDESSRVRSVGHYCVNCGTELVNRVIEGREVEACPNDGFVLWHDPKVSTAVVVEVGDGVIFGRRAIEPGYGLWCLPGGFVNDDEEPSVAAARECMEEICAAVEVTGLIGVYHVSKRDAPSMIGIAYHGRLVDGSLPSPGAEMLEVQVFPFDSPPPLAFPSHQKVLADLLRSRAKPGAVAPGSAASKARRASPPSPDPARPRPLRKP
jgi:ADP-ribose pyrophosphatase YjhB (NUDIX family)